MDFKLAGIVSWVPELKVVTEAVYPKHEPRPVRPLCPVSLECGIQEIPLKVLGGMGSWQSLVSLESVASPLQSIFWVRLRQGPFLFWTRPFNGAANRVTENRMTAQRTEQYWRSRWECIVSAFPGCQVAVPGELREPAEQLWTEWRRRAAAGQ